MQALSSASAKDPSATSINADMLPPHERKNSFNLVFIVLGIDPKEIKSI